ncbi:hypothetical protein SBOR_0762 [Sclerotinia borealis F-4128]|uniref:Uncharacterized protein n=1 Tax=Sclerotinia borealis (strain F-4128) TaxID=1432307 RepID=W9CW97_SCLBF|nr:hypothetical protein SBOR_0762 [Sclerotinia borealis F-4128]
MTTPNLNPIPVFRPSKKRKIYRQRNNDDEDGNGIEQSMPASTTPAPTLIPTEQSLDELIASSSVPIKREEGDEEDEKEQQEALNIAEILRLRKQRKKIGGVEFRAESKMREGMNGEVNGDALVKYEEKDAEDVQPDGGLSLRRFAPQMGVVGSGVDKHMMAYIESKLGHDSQSANSPFTNPRAESLKDESIQLSKELQRAPTTMGRLLEIDLGEEARVRNAHRTEMARRKAAGETIELEETAQPPSKPRLGRDGKPWRGRKRRGSDDIQRDALVDAILHENRLEIYEPVPTPSSTQQEGLANDEEVAEKFRRDWEEASSHATLQRQLTVSQRAAKEKKKPGQEKTEEEAYMKGPKLGGSRSARAAMRESMLKGKGLKR